MENTYKINGLIGSIPGVSPLVASWMTGFAAWVGSDMAQEDVAEKDPLLNQNRHHPPLLALWTTGFDSSVSDDEDLSYKL
ncbi:MAG: hypothetical protein HQL93_08060 [Magnetococcales bacterium]|nr:hypothetical protein [Magnetococcales bacterium]